MQCHCGAETSDHEVVRDKRLVGIYAKCVVCGRICWRWMAEVLREELWK